MDGIGRVVWPALLTTALGAIVPGCNQIAVIPVPGHRLRTVVERWHPPSRCWSGPTANLLRHLGLGDLAHRDPTAAFAALEPGIDGARPDPVRLLALAELADEVGRSLGPPARDDALAWSRDAAVYAALCLSATGVGPGADSTSRAACTVHNRAAARCLRLARTANPPGRSGWPDRLAAAGIVPVADAAVPEWTAMGFETIEPAEDRFATVKEPMGHRDGLGVPVIVHRGLHDADLAEWKPFGPEQAIFAATAVFRPRESGPSWRSQPVDLVFLDPTRTEVIERGGYVYPMAADLTTPMASRLAQGPIRNYEYLGVFDPEFYDERTGIYAVDPYQPGKVPVVFIHGFWSSPTVWVPILDALRADPAIRATYQFWVALYPSGYSLPTAALSIRRSLREVRQRFDPLGVDPALDRMVIVGKSTGGQASRLLVQSSGSALWDSIFARPIEQVRASPALRAELAAMLLIEPEPYIRRVLFVTTAHRGGNLARQPGVRLGVNLIRHNNPLRPAWAELRAANGPELFQPIFRDRALGSIDGMRADSPILAAIDAQPIAPGVAYHSIIATIHPGLPRENMTDGFVRYTQRPPGRRRLRTHRHGDPRLRGRPRGHRRSAEDPHDTPGRGRARIAIDRTTQLVRSIPEVRSRLPVTADFVQRGVVESHLNRWGRSRRIRPITRISLRQSPRMGRFRLSHRADVPLLGGTKPRTSHPDHQGLGDLPWPPACRKSTWTAISTCALRKRAS